MSPQQTLEVAMLQVPGNPAAKPGVNMHFIDARSCKEWIKSIPITNIPQAQQLVLDALRELNRAQFVPMERLTSMELMRDKVAFLQAEQRARYSGKTIPLSTAEMHAWEISNRLVEEMEAGYRKCLDEVSAGAHELEPHAALIVQRIMRYIGLQMLFAGMTYRRFDPALWTRLHLQWIEAEGRGLTQAKVRDSVGSIDGTSSIADAYIAILLAQLANTHELAPRQIDFVDALLKRFAAKVSVERDPPANGDALLLSVDLYGNSGVVLRPKEQAGEHTRVLNLEALDKSLRKRISKLQEGEAPVNLDLPKDWTSAECLTQIKRLYKIWCERGSTRAAATVPVETQAILSFGINATHYFLTGEVFEKAGKKRELTRQELNDLAMFGKVSESTIKSRDSGLTYAAETWGVVDEGKGYIRLLRPADSRHGVAIGKLAGVTLGAKGVMILAVIREIVQEVDGAIFVVFGLLPGKPEAIAVRPAGLVAGDQMVQSFRLPAMAGLSVPETLVVPSGLTQTGRKLELIARGNGARQATVNEFVERGADFDRIGVA
jgi:cyclic-di-GMP-binding protein